MSSAPKLRGARRQTAEKLRDFQEREARIEKAIKMLKHPQIPEEGNINYVAKQYALDRCTLSRRYRGVSQNRVASHVHQQVLTPGEEQSLVEFCHLKEKVFIPIKPRLLKSMAADLVEDRTGAKVPGPGKDWLGAFLRRNSSLRLTRKKPLKEVRVFASQPAVLESFFEVVCGALSAYCATT